MIFGDIVVIVTVVVVIFVSLRLAFSCIQCSVSSALPLEMNICLLVRVGLSDATENVEVLESDPVYMLCRKFEAEQGPGIQVQVVSEASL